MEEIHVSLYDAEYDKLLATTVLDSQGKYELQSPENGQYEKMYVCIEEAAVYRLRTKQLYFTQPQNCTETLDVVGDNYENMDSTLIPLPTVSLPNKVMELSVGATRNVDILVVNGKIASIVNENNQLVSFTKKQNGISIQGLEAGEAILRVSIVDNDEQVLPTTNNIYIHVK